MATTHNTQLIARSLGFRLKRHLDAFYEEYPEIDGEVRRVVMKTTKEMKERIREVVPDELVQEFKIKIEAIEREERARKIAEEREIMRQRVMQLRREEMEQRLREGEFRPTGEYVEGNSSEYIPAAARLEESDDDLIFMGVQPLCVKEEIPRSIFEEDPFKLKYEELLVSFEELKVEKERLLKENENLKKERDSYKASFENQLAMVKTLQEENEQLKKKNSDEVVERLRKDISRLKEDNRKFYNQNIEVKNNFYFMLCEYRRLEAKARANK